MSLGQLWRDRQFRRVLNLIDHLPSTAHYVAAVANDDDMAQAMFEAGKSQAGNGKPPLTEFSPEVAKLATLVDSVNRLCTMFLQANGAKGVKPSPPEPRPETAAQRFAKTQREDVRETVMSRLLPGVRRHAPIRSAAEPE